MIINTALLNSVLNFGLKEELSFTHLGLLIHKGTNMLSYFSDEKWWRQLTGNSYVKGVFTTKKMAPHVKKKGIIPIVCEDPIFTYYTLHNYIAKKNYRRKKTIVGKQCFITDRSYVAPYNVIIGNRVTIEPNATILPDVIIGDNSIIRANAVIGTEGYEYKRSSKGIIEVFHDGRVIIGTNVTVGANAVIAKGFSFRDTLIGDETKIDNLVHIAHGVHIGKACFIIASSMIAGSVTIKNNVWIGPNSNISNGVIIEDNSYVSLGSVVTKNVDKNGHVTGNFAISHSKFISNLKQSLK